MLFLKKILFQISPGSANLNPEAHPIIWSSDYSLFETRMAHKRSLNVRRHQLATILCEPRRFYQTLLCFFVKNTQEKVVQFPKRGMTWVKHETPKQPLNTRPANDFLIVSPFLPSNFDLLKSFWHPAVFLTMTATNPTETSPSKRPRIVAPEWSVTQIASLAKYKREHILKELQCSDIEFYEMDRSVYALCSPFM